MSWDLTLVNQVEFGFTLQHGHLGRFIVLVSHSHLTQETVVAGYLIKETELDSRLPLCEALSHSYLSKG